MAAIPWNEFSKEELVEILNELAPCRYTVEELWSESDVHYVKECGCAPSEHKLPPRVLVLRDRVAQRIATRGTRRASPLKRLLQSPFKRHRA